MQRTLRTTICAALAATALSMLGCRTIGAAGESAGHAAGETAEAAGHAAGTAAKGAGDVIEDTAHAADREIHDAD